MPSKEPWKHNVRGYGKHKCPLYPEVMLKACRKLAGDYRSLGDNASARSLDAQGDRWQREIETGECNRSSRLRLGEPVW